MSTSNNDEAEEVCASCGNSGVDDTKLKKCNACKIVRYCSVACQKEHRPQHKRACKRRAAEIREELLFRQPESSHLGDCLICCLPLPYDLTKSRGQPCCAKFICNGCHYANKLREAKESLEQKCPFCRTPCPKNVAESNLYLMKRIQANDPVAIYDMGARHYPKQNFSRAFEEFTKAVELGDVESHFELAKLYRNGKGVERDKKKENHHLEEAAIRGHPGARHNLGVNECDKGNYKRGVKHFIIASNLGNDHSMENLKELYRNDLVKKEDLAAALRAHKAAVDATKSPQREVAEQYFNNNSES